MKTDNPDVYTWIKSKMKCDVIAYNTEDCILENLDIESNFESFSYLNPEFLSIISSFLEPVSNEYGKEWTS